MEFARLLLLSCLMICAEGYSNGKVEVSCEDMRPRHKSSPQTSESPFTVSTTRTHYSAGQQVTVVLSAPSSRSFEGFLLQAREVGGTSAVGTFVTVSTGTQTLTCAEAVNSAVSHSSDEHRTLLQFRWRPASERAVQFHATFVEGFSTYWVDVASPLVKFMSTGPNSTEETSTPAISSARPTSNLPELDISAEGCGGSRVCFREPSDCDPALDTNCFFMSAMLVSPGSFTILFQMSGPSDGYISFGFSDDQEMGNDDIYLCVIDSRGMVQLQRAFSTGTTMPQSVPLGSVSDVKTSVQNSIIRCSFTSTNNISTQTSSRRSSQDYYLLFAHGPSHNGQIQIHKGTFVSRNKINVSKPSVVQKAQTPHIIKAHGALMLIGWMSTGTVGMMVARFKKGLAKGHTLCGKDMWFVVHVSVMCLTVAITIIAFILVFSYARTWSGGAHPVLGCLVMILSLLQPLGALLRCGPQHPKRFLFNWSHALNALSIKALSMAAIFTGLQLIDSSENLWLLKVMGGFVGWEAFFFILSDLNLRWTDKSEDTHLLKVAMDALTGVFFVGSLAFLVALLVGIGMS